MRYQESEGKCNVLILSDNKTLKRKTLQAVLLIRCIQIYNLKFSNTLYLSFHSLVISCLTWAHLFQQCRLPFFLCFFYARKDIQHLFFTLCTFKITCSEQTLLVLANGNPNIFIFISFFPWGKFQFISTPPRVYWQNVCPAFCWGSSYHSDQCLSKTGALSQFVRCFLSIHLI